MTKIRYYYENICVAFTSIRVFNPDISLVFFTTETVPDLYSKILDFLDVEIKYFKVKYQLKYDKDNKFSGSLFLLDCISNQIRNTLYLDPDVICLDSLMRLQLKENDVLVYEVQDYVENRDSLRRISAFLLEESNLQLETLRYFGGEFFFIPQSRLLEVKTNIERIWSKNLSFTLTNENILQTEEHFLTLALHDLKSIKSTNLISRIWTTRSYRKVPKDYANLPLIHLPAEKDKGISILFNMIYGAQDCVNLEIFSSKNRKKLFKVLGISKNFVAIIKFQILRIIKVSIEIIRNKDFFSHFN